MKCLICGEEREKLGYHIQQKHKLTSKEYYDKFLKKANEDKCVVCGNETGFISLDGGYRTTCSKECSAVNPKRIEKVKNASLEKYGTEFPIASKEVKAKISKTLNENYGVDSPFKSKEIQNKAKNTIKKNLGVEYPLQNQEVYRKLKETILEKYGVENVLQLESNREALKKTFLSKFGVEYPLQSEEFRNYLSELFLERYGVKNPSQSNFIQERNKIKHLKKVNSVESLGCTQLNKLIKQFGITWTRHLEYPYIERFSYKFVPNSFIKEIENFCKGRENSGSYFENSVKDFILSIYKDEIKANDRTQIQPLELDIYIPDKKIAIECNGTWHHSINNETPINYHLDKTRMCENKGIRLIHIFEWEWQNKRSICQSIISSALGIYKKRIYARNCEVKEVNVKTSIKFLNENYIKGGMDSDYRLGLFFNEELVQLMVLNKRKENFEISCICSKLNTQIVGGLSRLINYLPECVKEAYCYIDRGKACWQGYLSNFKFISEIDPKFSHYKGEVQIKENTDITLVKEVLKENFNSNLSLSENLLKNGYLQVYDSGYIKLKLSKI